MAEIAYNAVGNLITKLVILGVKEVGSALRVKSDLDKLKETLTIIDAVRFDVEDSQHRMKRELQQWLGRLTDICTSAEDVLDEFEIADLQLKVLRQKRNFRKKVRRFSSSANPAFFYPRMSKKIKGIVEELDKVAGDRHKFHISGPHVHSNVDPEWRETHSEIDVTNVVGRDRDIEELVCKLEVFDEYDSCRQSKSDAAVAAAVVAVVGIGGVGKTTVVKYVYNDARVSQHFELRKWVFVGQNFDVKKIIGEIVDRKDSSMQQLQDPLKKTLRGKRYLLVLDDVWNEDQGKWLDLKELLCGAYGSKIIVTTRSQSVAKMISGYMHTLQSLSTEDSKSLFMRWALVEGQNQHSQNLIRIAGEIAEKSVGVPLAITTLAKFLNKHGEQQWSHVRNKSFWSLAQDKSDIAPVVQLSYNYLTSFNLKQCFSICAMFEKGTELRSTEMIYIWMALGLLEPGHNENQLEAEDIGQRFFNELNSKLFFRDVQDSWFFHKFKLHDLMHDLALSVTKGQFAILSDDTPEVNRNLDTKVVRHVSLQNANQLVRNGDIPTCVVELTNLRTIIEDSDVGPWCSTPFLETCISKFTYLRVLHFTDTNIMVLPNSIGELKHLKYLSLSGNTTIRVLPDSLCNLVSLQALCLEGCTSLKRLPEKFGELISLRYLYLTTRETQLPYLNDGCLDSLRYLEIKGCSNLESLSNLNMKLHLRTLIVKDCGNLQSFGNTLGHLQRLENLVFCNCPGLTLKTMEQNITLLNLRVVAFEGLLKLEYLPQWLAVQTSLQRLEIYDCPKMDSIMEGSNRLPRDVKQLSIWCCPRLVETCQHWEWDRIAHIPLIQFNGEIQNKA